jgi:hypothetical protein
MKSKYADTLNALVEMQDSMAYAVRKSDLVKAEIAIVTLEKRDAVAVSALKEIVAESECRNTNTAIQDERKRFGDLARTALRHL